MKNTLRLSLLALASLFNALAQNPQGIFQASVSVYPGPLSSPTVAYSATGGSDYAYYSRREIADDIVIRGEDHAVASIGFSYYANYAEASGLTFRVYETGYSSLPGALLYSTPVDVVQGGGRVDISFKYDLVNNVIPQRIFISLEFSSKKPTDKAGVLLANAPATVGYSSSEILEKRGNRWLPVGFRFKGGLRLGVSKFENKLIFLVADEPNTTVRIRGKNNLNGGWTDLGEVTTESDGIAEFEQDTQHLDVAFFEVYTP